MFKPVKKKKKNPFPDPLSPIPSSTEGNIQLETGKARPAAKAARLVWLLGLP